MSEEIHESLRTASPDAAAMKLVELHRRSIEDEPIPPDAMGYEEFCELCERVNDERFHAAVAATGFNGYSGDPLDPEVLEVEAVYHAACELLARFVADEDGCGSGLEAALHLIRRENEMCDEHLVVGTMCDGEFRALEGFGSLEAGKRDGEPANETNE